MASRPTLKLLQGSHAPAPAGRCDLTGLESELADLREAVFALGDDIRRALPPERWGVTVPLQAAAHQLGDAARLLADGR
jgi:hypothetical protein